MPRFSVLIVNFNGGSYLQNALTSLAAQTHRDFEVIVVDNASTDGSADGLNSDGLPAFKLLEPGENLGFAAGNNLAAKSASGDWLALLNPDAEAEPDWLEQIIAGMGRHPDANMFACLQYNLDDPTLLDGVGDCYFGLGVAWRGGFGRSAEEVPAEGECFSPCGASAVYNTSVFLDHGGFDERFFCFGEDTDLAFRMRLAGEICVFLPSAIIRHAGGALAGRVSAFSLFHGARNRVWAYLKNMPGWSFWLTLPAHAAITAVILFRGLFTGRFGDTWRGVRAAIDGAEPFWRDRETLQKSRRAPIWSVLAAMSWNPWRFATRRGDVRPRD